jgi:hypothetical protein
MDDPDIILGIYQEERDRLIAEICTENEFSSHVEVKAEKIKTENLQMWNDQDEALLDIALHGKDSKYYSTWEQISPSLS